MKPMTLAGSCAPAVGFGGAVVGGIAYSASSHRPSQLNFSNQEELGSFGGGGCVRGLLSWYEQELFETGDIGSWAWGLAKDKFNNPAHEAPRGCVEISWDKSTWTNGKWRGIIRYEWLFGKGSEFIVVNGFYDSRNEQEDLDDGQQSPNSTRNNWRAVYVNKKGGKKRWTMWNKSKSIEDKFLAKPKLLTQWPFEKDKKCSSSDACHGQGDKSEHFEAKWKWKAGGTASAFPDLIGDFFTVFGYLFDKEEKHHLNKLKSLIQEEKGVWERF